MFGYPRFILFMLFMVSVFSTESLAQYLVLSNGDTLQDITIRETLWHTNEDYVTVRTEGTNWQQVPAEEIDLFYLDNSFYYSRAPEGEERKRIMKYVIYGEASLVESWNRVGQMTFYMVYQDRLISLENDKYDLDALFWDQLPEYNEFRNTFNKKAFYDRKTLAEHLSRYNNFRNSEVYEPRFFKYGHLLRLNLFGAYNQNLFNDLNRPEPYGLGLSSSTGLHLMNKYSPHASFHVLLSYKYSRAKSDIQQLVENSIGLEASISFTAFRNRGIVVWVGPMVGPAFHFYSSVRQGALPYNPKNINGLSVGYYLYTYTEYKDNWGLLLRGGTYRLPVGSTGRIFVRPDLYNIHIQVGVTYRIL